MAWQYLGQRYRAAFEMAVRVHVRFYLEQTRQEKTQNLSVTERWLSDADWHAFSATFATKKSPLSTRVLCVPLFDRLCSCTVVLARLPAGVSSQIGGSWIKRLDLVGNGVLGHGHTGVRRGPARCPSHRLGLTQRGEQLDQPRGHHSTDSATLISPMSRVITLMPVRPRKHAIGSANVKQTAVASAITTL